MANNTPVLVPLEPKWMRPVMNLWLTANISAHDFIDASYWKDNYHETARQLPQSDVTVAVDGDRVLGFVGAQAIEPTGTGYIAGIFVDTADRGQGIGRQLLEHCKETYDSLVLHVYEKNQGAIRFYLREGFTLTQELWDEENQQEERELTWRRP